MMRAAVSRCRPAVLSGASARPAGSMAAGAAGLAAAEAEAAAAAAARVASAGTAGTRHGGEPAGPEPVARGSWLRQAVGLTLIGATAAALWSALDEMLLYRRCRDAAIGLAADHPGLLRALGGGPLLEAPWYNCSLNPSRDGQLASCTIPVSGATKGSDIVIRVMRSEGGMARLLYNSLGPARWDIITCDALLPAQGGLPRRLSLLDAEGGDRSGDAGTGQCPPGMLAPRAAAEGDAAMAMAPPGPPKGA